jgi:hypothetical protein
MGRSAPKMGKQAMPVIKPKAKWDKLIFLRWKGMDGLENLAGNHAS